MLKIRDTALLCFDPRYQKWVKMGNVQGKTFFKSVERKHFMRVVNGYGIQYDAFIQFPSYNLHHIQITELNSDNVWLSTTKDWLAHGKVADYGNGKQIFLSLKYMKLQTPQLELL